MIELAHEDGTRFVIPVKYFTEDIEKLEYINGKSDWIDLRAAKDTVIQKGEFCLIHLGIAMQLPKGFEAHIVPRSSTFKNFGIIQANGIGIIDNSYCGDDDEWLMPVYATRDTMIKKNMRVAQFRIVENQPKLKFNQVDGFAKTSSRGGFGSTGMV